MSDGPSKIIPNSFQMPNFLVDELERYLSGNELKCALIVCRKTFGWHKRSDRISKSQLVELSGLAANTIDDCMTALVQFGIVLRVAENASNAGVEWSIQTDDGQVDIAGLEQREAARRAQNEQKTSKIRRKEGGVVQRPDLAKVGSSNDQAGGVVQRPPQKPVKDINVVVKPNDFAKIAKAYEGEIGALTAFIRDKINDWLEMDHYPPDWCVEAIGEAARQNHRSLAYVDAILKNWKANGRGARKAGKAKEQTNGHDPNRTAEPTPASIEVARQVLAQRAAKSGAVPPGHP